MRIEIKIDDKEETFEEDIHGFTGCFVVITDRRTLVHVGTQVDDSLNEDDARRVTLDAFKAHALKIKEDAKSDKLKAAFDNLLELL